MTPATRQRPGACPPRLERGEMAKGTPAERFWMKVDKNGPIPEYRPDFGPCWIWLAGTTSCGYGRFYPNTSPEKRSAVMAHRWSYEEMVGPIPNGLQIDHLCRVTACVNPDHLEPVTPAENVLRALRAVERLHPNAAKTHCKHGHELTPENVYIFRARGSVERECRACGRAKAKARRLARKLARDDH